MRHAPRFETLEPRDAAAALGWLCHGTALAPPPPALPNNPVLILLHVAPPYIWDATGGVRIFIPGVPG